jgi:hypothetical protein
MDLKGSSGSAAREMLRNQRAIFLADPALGATEPRADLATAPDPSSASGAPHSPPPVSCTPIDPSEARNRTEFRASIAVRALFHCRFAQAELPGPASVIADCHRGCSALLSAHALPHAVARKKTVARPASAAGKCERAVAIIQRAGVWFNFGCAGVDILCVRAHRCRNWHASAAAIDSLIEPRPWHTGGSRPPGTVSDGVGGHPDASGYSQ